MYDLICSVLTMSRARCVPVDPYINQTVSDYRSVVKLVPTLCQELGQLHTRKEPCGEIQQHRFCYVAGASSYLFHFLYDR